VWKVEITSDFIHVFRLYNRDLQTFLSEGHISCYTTVRGPDILHNVIASGYVTFHYNNKFFVIIYYFFITNKMSYAAG